jgi:oxygen-dependent protoporphyrinogen oxidase
MLVKIILFNREKMTPTHGFDAQVIVIGAGIAGLTAAWFLKEQGIDVLVLEAEQIVGGRMKSFIVDDAIIDCGAQFLSSAYSIIPKLIEETGLIDEFINTAEWVGLVKNSNISLIHSDKPWSLVKNHILSIWDLLLLGFKQFKFILGKKSLALNDITQWVQYDDQLASNWIIENFGKAAAQELTSPIFNGFYFQSLDTSSAAMAAAVLAFSAHHPRTMTLKDGIGSLPLKLAEKLTIKTGVVATEIIETSSNVKIISNRDEFKAKHAIVTTPAPITKNLIINPDKETSTLFNTPYSSSMLISFLTHEDWSPPSSICSAYGFLFNPCSDSKIAAFTIENKKCFTRKKSGYLLNIMLTDKWAKNFFHLTDESIYSEIQTDIENILPKLYIMSYKKVLFRWPYAMPCTPIGRAKAVTEYRQTRTSNVRIWLAGDYLGFPWADSAAQTGLWASEQVKKYL